MTGPMYPCLWYDGCAKEAATYYCTIFKNSKIISENPLVVIFELNSQKFMGLNGGPKFKFNESISYVINCKDQEEIDYYWNKLTEGGEESMCGWLKDKFGMSWQIVPEVLGTLMNDSQRRERVVQAFLKMKKFDIAALLKA